MSKIITIDGPAASGKGTVARRLAEQLDFFYLDTGATYRLVGLAANAANITPEDHPNKIAELARNMVNGFDISQLNHPELKSDLAGRMASRCAQFPVVRDAVLELQRGLAERPPTAQKGTVMDGRDCGTVICPTAPYKFYITASVDVRAKRRFDELINRGDNPIYDEVLAEMKIRDDRDMNRATAPLKPADDAITIDTDQVSADDVFNQIFGKINAQ
jgi:cytidylate kinase